MPVLPQAFQNISQIPFILFYSSFEAPWRLSVWCFIFFISIFQEEREKEKTTTQKVRGRKGKQILRFSLVNNISGAPFSHIYPKLIPKNFQGFQKVCLIYKKQRWYSKITSKQGNLFAFLHNFLKLRTTEYY